MNIWGQWAIFKLWETYNLKYSNKIIRTNKFAILKDIKPLSKTQHFFMPIPNYLKLKSRKKPYRYGNINEEKV